MSKELAAPAQPVVRIDFSVSKADPSSHCAMYQINGLTGRTALAEVLKHATNAVFGLFPKNHCFQNYYSDLHLAIGTLTREQPTVYLDLYLARKSKIQVTLNRLMSLLKQMEEYSESRPNFWTTFKLRFVIEEVTNQLWNLTLRDASQREAIKVAQNYDSSACFIISFSELPPVLAKAFNYETDETQTEEKNTTTPAILDPAQEEWLASLSPELKAAYEETENLIEEVTPLILTSEDEYFIEQIQADYYPHIFGSLKSLARSESDFAQKETVVLEVLKQFKIIQLGLQKIVDRAVAHRMNAIKSQTDFLRDKVLGSEGFSLTPNEAELAIDNSVAEAQRIREDLYQKHVAPMLEKNRQEHEEAVAKIKADYAEAEKQLEVDKQEYLEDFRRTLEEQERSFTTEKFALEDKMHRMQYDHRVAIEQLNKEHAHAMTSQKTEVSAELRRYKDIEKDLEIAVSEILEFQRREHAARQERDAALSKLESQEEENEAKKELFAQYRKPSTAQIAFDKSDIVKLLATGTLEDYVHSSMEKKIEDLKAEHQRKIMSYHDQVVELSANLHNLTSFTEQAMALQTSSDKQPSRWRKQEEQEEEDLFDFYYGEVEEDDDFQF